MTSTLILLSGGLDSAVCAAMFRDADRLAIGFDYGQPHAIELQYAQAFADKELMPFEVIQLPRLPKVNGVVFAGRNMLLLSFGVAIAQLRGYKSVVIGCNYGDYRDFPDCRPAFVSHLKGAAMIGYGVDIHAPLLHMTKAQVKDEATRLSVDVAETWSCYAPVDGRPCWVCLACKVRG